MAPSSSSSNADGGDDSVRFEDLTVDDDLPLIDRLVRYCHSPVALQRLVHVKMLAEASELTGYVIWCLFVFVVVRFVAARRWRWWWCWPASLPHSAANPFPTRTTDYSCLPPSCPDPPCPALPCPALSCPLCSHTTTHNHNHNHHSGMATRKVLVPALRPLVNDPESVIRQHVAAQLLAVSVVCMMDPLTCSVQDCLDNPDVSINTPKRYNKEGYDIVTGTVVEYMNALLSDSDLDVRRAAANSLSGLALQLKPEDVPAVCLPVPLRLVYQKPSHPETQRKKKSEADQRLEELRITSANLLAELGGAASEHPALHAESEWVGAQVLPAVLELCDDPSFRVRRSGVQALPRILAACDLELVGDKIMPIFEKLSTDSVHRIRKSAGECLVDMSRALMIMSMNESDPERKQFILKLRRYRLVHIADRLIQDGHKMVRQGMMQFLGPFIASFYPYQFSALHTLLPSKTESDGSNHMGIAAQFFPHASSMVSRLNSSQNAITTAPAPVHNIDQMATEVKDFTKLKRALPLFLQATRMSNLSLSAVVAHRKAHPPDPDDLAAICDRLLDYFAALAIVTTGDENTDAEMRVYCAYSFPAIVLLLGQENWEGPMKTCFFSLLNSNYGADSPSGGGDAEHADPPLPVKRCLASSLHTVAHVLSPSIAAKEILPVFRDYFLKDSDDSVRLNVIRNFPALLKILPPSQRKQPFLEWSEVVRGEELLGALKRSSTNPLVLNWRQRDYLGRSLPELMGLVEPTLIKEHLWPILQTLLTDGVSTVREDAMWAVPALLQAYCPANLKGVDRDFSTRECKHIVTWLQETILRVGVIDTSNTSKNNNHHKSDKEHRSSSNSNSNNTSNNAPVKSANFSDRQLYCRICATVGVALRFSEGYEEEEEGDDDDKDPVSVLSIKFKSLLASSKGSDTVHGPYERLTAAEQKHLTRILMDDLLDPALAMKEDRISNVRVTLMRALQLMPPDVQQSAKCKRVLKNLVEEVETWESFGPEPQVQESGSRSPSSSGGSPGKKGKTAKSIMRGTAAGPVDVDEVSLTPQSSRDEDDDNDDSPSRGHPPQGWRTVVFDEGPIGMQLEPTAHDRGCRVFDFLDAGPDQPSPARMSGKINVGDVIVSVNGTILESYDDTISLLKAGGRREIVFRPGTDDDAYEGYISDDAGGSSDDDDDDRERKKKEKKVKKEKKAKKEKKTKKDDKKKEKKDTKKKKDGKSGNASSDDDD